MNRPALALAAVLSLAGFAAQAQEADPAGQYAISAAPSALTRGQVQADVQKTRVAPNPYANSYNQLSTFKGQRTRAEVTAEYLAARKAVASMAGEIGNPAALAELASQPGAKLAGTPVNAQ